MTTYPTIVRLLTESPLKWPKIRLTAAGEPLHLARAGQGSRYPGSINLTNGGRYGEPHSVFYGRIHLDGKLQAYRDCGPDVIAVLSAFDADPEATARAFGRRVGCCCFCSAELTDERSITVGYGPTCAKHYGLPWGDKPQTPVRAASAAVSEVAQCKVTADNGQPVADTEPSEPPCGAPGSGFKIGGWVNNPERTEVEAEADQAQGRLSDMLSLYEGGAA